MSAILEMQRPPAPADMQRAMLWTPRGSALIAVTEHEFTKPLPFAAYVADGDGVLWDTVPHHLTAWRHEFELVPGVGAFTDDDYHMYVDGQQRDIGINLFLASRNIYLTEEEKDALGERKQALYLELIDKYGVKVFPDAIGLLSVARKRGVLIAIASSSKNTPFIMEKAGLQQDFADVVVAGDTVISHGRVFKEKMVGKKQIVAVALRELDVSGPEAVGLEDAVDGVAAHKGEGLMSIAVDRVGNEKLAKAGAHVRVSNLYLITNDTLGEEYLRRKEQQRVA